MQITWKKEKGRKLSMKHSKWCLFLFVCLSFLRGKKPNFSISVPIKITEGQLRISRMKTHTGSQNFNSELNSTTTLFVQSSVHLKISQAKMSS